jgi:type IV pilus assembly protein PilC
LIALIKVGEEVNKLDIIFNTLGSQYSEEIDQDTKLLGSLVEPLLIIFLGLFVAVILVSMYMPLFRLGTSIY